MTRRSAIVGPLIVTVIFITVACAYWPTFSYLLGVGRHTDNSSHGALVMLVSLTLIWRRGAELAALPFRPFWLGLIGLIVIGFVWLAGQIVYTRVLTQFAVLAMIPLAALTLLGFRWIRAMAFPLFLLAFAVPIWSPIVPTLVRWTAKIAELSIRASGVPMYREGAYFVIPSGTWSIADTCSGVAFLSTSLLLGVLYAWVMYRSPTKRAAFIAGSVAIGVAGNWVRVYLTIMIAHYTDNRLLRDDHYTFGWVLFAVFLFFLFWFGMRYRDTVQTPSATNQESLADSQATSLALEQSSAQRLLVVGVAMVASLVVWPQIESRLSARADAAMAEIASILPQAGWSRIEQPSVEWVPEISNPSQVRVQTFEKNGQRVDVFVGVFRHESWSSKLVTTSNQLAGGDKSQWSLADRGVVLIDTRGSAMEAKTGVILGRTGRILAWHWYWIQGFSTGNDVRAKLEQLLVRLYGGAPASAWVAIYTHANLSPDVSPRLLQDFMRDMGGSLENALVRTVGP